MTLDLRDNIGDDIKSQGMTSGTTCCPHSRKILCLSSIIHKSTLLCIKPTGFLVFFVETFKNTLMSILYRNVRFVLFTKTLYILNCFFFDIIGVTLVVALAFWCMIREFLSLTGSWVFVINTQNVIQIILVVSSKQKPLLDYNNYRANVGNRVKQLCQLFHMHIPSGQNLKL